MGEKQAEPVRVIALGEAIRWHQGPVYGQQTPPSREAGAVIVTAKAFEAYLRGEKEEA